MCVLLPVVCISKPCSIAAMSSVTLIKVKGTLIANVARPVS